MLYPPVGIITLRLCFFKISGLHTFLFFGLQILVGLHAQITLCCVDSVSFRVCGWHAGSPGVRTSYERRRRLESLRLVRRTANQVAAD